MLRVEALELELQAESGVVRAVDGLQMSIDRGETFALVGESGCGKSMTALALMRLLPEGGRIRRGHVRLGDEDLLDLPESAMRRMRGGHIGMIFQEPSTSLNPVMRIGDQVVEAIETHTALRGPASRAKALDWLRRVGIPEPERRLADYPFRMSGGQKQRVMIAIALAAEPELLIADEPTTALDVTIQAQILELLADLQREHRMGLLLITHDLAVVAGMADRVALMYAGQIVEIAPADTFFSTPAHPYAAALLRALPAADRRSQPLEAIPGTVPSLAQEFVGCRFAPRCPRAMPACATTAVPMVRLAPAHEVRCLLYTDRGAPADAARADAAAASGEAVGQGAGQGAGIAAVAAGGARVDASIAPRPAPADVAAGGQPLLQVKELQVRFAIRSGLLQRPRGWFEAVRGVSFDLGRGGTVALVGESGCGKTTTGKAIVQLLRGVAHTQGQARLDGVDLFACHGAELLRARRRIQIVFQDPFASLDPRMRVRELLEEGVAALVPELDPAARRQRIAALVEQVGLRPDSLERFPHEFSGGQRQRIAIARALAVGPEVIVCDEPTSALDVSVQAQILNLLRGLQRDLGVSYLFITHNIGVVEYIADQVVVMRAGQVEEAGPVDRVLSQPASGYTRTLLESVPRLRRP